MMSYKLEKPYTDTQRADFVCEHQGLNYYEDDNCIIMYENTESVTDGIVTDISDTDDYKAKVLAKENAGKKTDLQAQIDELDKKSIRALREGGTMSDGMTYLEYYTNQITTLRTELAGI
jgi:hypothetical protein